MSRSGQNTSSAVMQQRREPKDSFDYFPTPLWATRALCEWLLAKGYANPHHEVHEPACGEGHMARGLAEYFADVYASDIQDMGYGEVSDYLFANDLKTDWVITNPPFRLASQFIEEAYHSAYTGVAMLVRTSFLEGVNRYNDLYKVNPPNFILQYSERVPMVKGRVDAKASTATSYCWVVWTGTKSPTQFDWIAPCRRRLEKEGDYTQEASVGGTPSRDT